MAKTNATAADILKLIFNATTFADIAENDTTGPATNLSVALHTGDPGETGNQTTNETAYTGYARVNVARTAGGWNVTVADPASVSPVAAIEFGECTASPGAAITHWSVGTGVGDKILYKGAVTPNITMAVGVIPRLKTTTAITED